MEAPSTAFMRTGFDLTPLRRGLRQVGLLAKPPTVTAKSLIFQCFCLMYGWNSRFLTTVIHAWRWIWWRRENALLTVLMKPLPDPTLLFAIK
jgi:hypothetical protein